MSKNANRPVLLLVDDDTEFLGHMADRFQSEGFETVSASDGSSALNILMDGKTEIAAVISDFKMPGLSGKELVMAIRTLGKTIPVFILTGSREFSESEATKAGATGLFYKPTSLRTIAKAIQASLLMPLNLKVKRKKQDSAG